MNEIIVSEANTESARLKDIQDNAQKDDAEKMADLCFKLLCIAADGISQLTSDHYLTECEKIIVAIKASTPCDCPV